MPVGEAIEAGKEAKVFGDIVKGHNPSGGKPLVRFGPGQVGSHRRLISRSHHVREEAAPASGRLGVSGRRC